MTLDDCQVLRDLAAAHPETAAAIERVISEIANLRQSEERVRRLLRAEGEGLAKDLRRETDAESPQPAERGAGKG